MMTSIFCNCFHFSESTKHNALVQFVAVLDVFMASLNVVTSLVEALYTELQTCLIWHFKHFEAVTPMLSTSEIFPDVVIHGLGQLPGK